MDDVRQRIREEAQKISAHAGLDDLMHRVRRRSQRRRLSAIVVGLGGFAAVAVVVSALAMGSGGPRPQSNASPSATTSGTVAVSGTCDYGPWIRACPEADWARSTVAAAGLTIVEEIPASLVVQHADGEIYFWAMDPANHEGVEPLETELTTGDPFHVVEQVDGVSVYHLRTWWAWTVHDLNVWVSVASGSDPPPVFLEALVRASIEVPY